MIQMRVLVIGGTGFIGSRVVRRLVDEENTVAVYHRGQTKSALPDGVLDFVDPASTWPIQKFPTELFEFAPDVVIHTFAMGEIDASAAVAAFQGRTGRLVVLSSGDVYGAYGRFIGIEPGPIELGLLTENSPLRTVLYPYRKRAKSNDSWEYGYEKILVEKAILGAVNLPGTVLRLPKVYGPGKNQDLGTIYSNRNHPRWRWTHGYVDNVVAGIVLAAMSRRAAGTIYNLGEEHTATIAERLEWMPTLSMEGAAVNDNFNYAQDIAYDTSRIRRELGYREIIPERDAVLQTLGSIP